MKYLPGAIADSWPHPASSFGAGRMRRCIIEASVRLNRHDSDFKEALVSDLAERPTPATVITDSFHWTDSVGTLVLGVITLVMLLALLRCNASRLKAAKA